MSTCDWILAINQLELARYVQHLEDKQILVAHRDCQLFEKKLKEICFYSTYFILFFLVQF